MKFHSLFKKMRWAPVFALVCAGALTAVHSASTQELDGDPIPNVEATAMPTPEPGKVWDVGPVIDPGTSKVSAGTIDWNQTTQVSVEGAKDSDHWKEGTQEGTEADGVTYQWSGAGIFASPNAASSEWTPPTLPGDNASSTYTLTCTVNDKPTPVGEGEGGTRDDSSEELTVEVKVTRKKWDKGSAIELGGPITSNASLQPSLQGGMKLYVEQGQQVLLNIPTATDKDHWVYRDTEDTADDEVNYTWSGANNLSTTQGQSVTWTAPFLPGQVTSAAITLTCTVNDKPTDIDTANGETGTRDDAPNSNSTITFVVVKTVWSPNQEIGFHPQLDAQGHFDKYNVTWIPDGELVSPVVNAATGKVSAMPGQHVACALNEAHDWDSWTKGDIAGPAGGDLVEDKPLSYRWTASEGQFWVGEGANAHLADHADTREAVWVAPDDVPNNTDVTLTCTVDDAAGDRVNVPLEGGSHNDSALVRTIEVKVGINYKLTWDDEAAKVAVGGKMTLAHQAKFTLTVKDANNVPLANYAVLPVKVIGGGRGGNETIVAKAVYDVLPAVTDNNGQIKGTFTSGKRNGELTKIGIRKAIDDPSSAVIASLDIKPIWNDVPEGLGENKRWQHSSYYYFGETTPVTYQMALKKNDTFIPISLHQIEFSTDELSAWVWNPDKGPYGGYDYKTYSANELDGEIPVFTDPDSGIGGEPGASRTPRSFMTWNPNTQTATTESYAQYLSSFVVEENALFQINEVKFIVTDKDVFASPDNP